VEDAYSAKADQDARSGELQHLFRTQYVNTVAGIGYFSVNQDLRYREDFTWPGLTPPLFLFTTTRRSNLEIDHTNIYVYSYIKLLKELTLTVGASGDLYNQDDTEGDLDIDKNQFNPKFGIVWNPLQDTTLRAAAFRTFKRTLITDQTLEPTQVAGFNQFFDDGNATQSWVYGGAVDQKFSKDIYGGAELYYRDLEVPFFAIATAPATGLLLDQSDWEEYLGRAYLYWTPARWLSLSAEYMYEKFERSEKLTEGIKRLTTHRFPFGVKFFHDCGITVGVKATYVNQDGDFESLFTPGTFQTGDDTFWVVDASISYRLPNRYGFITVGVSNLFDEEFRYFDADANNPWILPDRIFFAKVTLALP
jgi:outer membrane receptor protein involved in Fe transport